MRRLKRFYANVSNINTKKIWIWTKIIISQQWSPDLIHETSLSQQKKVKWEKRDCGSSDFRKYHFLYLFVFCSLWYFLTSLHVRLYPCLQWFPIFFMTFLLHRSFCLLFDRPHLGCVELTAWKSSQSEAMLIQTFQKVEKSQKSMDAINHSLNDAADFVFFQLYA